MQKFCRDFIEFAVACRALEFVALYRQGQSIAEDSFKFYVMVSLIFISLR